MSEPENTVSNGAETPEAATSPTRATKSPKAAKKTPSKKKSEGAGKKTGGAPPRMFPAVTLEDALKIATAIKQFNAGNAWPPSEVAKALKLGAQGVRFFYLAAASRDYGLTTGSRATATIELAETGRKLVYAPSPEAEKEATLEAFFNVTVFKDVYQYYKGEGLPELKYLSNTLESVFHLPQNIHTEFYKLYTENVKYLQAVGAHQPGIRSKTEHTGGAESGHSVVFAEPKEKTKLVAFVVMPFSEKTDAYPDGFFGEVLRNLIAPAGVEAGFKVETAKRDGSDIIQSTIVNDLLNADLVVADLSEHNPNVLFELGLRMAFDKPTALIRAKGTPAIFDVDNMLRVFDYDPNLWKSTLEKDVPNLSAHIRGTWDTRDTAITYMKLLKRD
jgi:hypothetical protein